MSVRSSPWNRTRRVRSERLGLIERIFGAFDPDIPGSFERLYEGDELTVRGNLRAGDFRIAKEEFAVDYRRLAILGENLN